MEQGVDQGVGAEIKRLREEREWSMAKLAVEADMSVSGVSMIENGKRNLTTTTLAKLARAFGVEVRDLFPLEQAPLPDFEDGRRESKPREAADHDLYRWVRDKTIEELQQIALEEARFAKPQTVEELFEGHKANKKAQLEGAHRRVLATATIVAINKELGRRGVPSPVELVARVFNDAMSSPEEAAQRSHEGQETA